MRLSDISKIFAFIDVVNSLKYEMRFGGNCDSPKRDNVAAHIWRMALLSYIVAEQFVRSGELKLDVLKVIKLALVHDLPEALVGDTSFDKVYLGQTIKEDKSLGEHEAIRKLGAMLPEGLDDEVVELWEEYESSNSLESKFVKIMDKLEAAHQSMVVGVKNMKTVPPMVTHSNKGYGWVPELDILIEYVRKELREHFAEHGEPWLPEYELK